jgi:hypothetical protein
VVVCSRNHIKTPQGTHRKADTPFQQVAWAEQSASMITKIAGSAKPCNITQVSQTVMAQ